MKKNLMLGMGFLVWNMATTSFAEGQATIKDEGSQKNIVQIAAGSKDHTTLVTALTAGDRVDPLANPGPFTVFAPTNAAFDKLPPGTVANLLKPESKETLINILEYHVFVGVVDAPALTDGMTLNQVNLENVTIKVQGKNKTVNGANILASIRGSNGVVHVIDGVLLPPTPKP